MTPKRVDFHSCTFREYVLVDIIINIIYLPSVESQKGVNDAQRFSVENQKSAIAVFKVYGDSALLVLNGT